LSTIHLLPPQASRRGIARTLAALAVALASLTVSAVAWNGKAWQAQSVPAPAKGKFSALYGLYCQKSFCAASGKTGPSGSAKGTALAAFSAGSSWKLVAAG
jgi:hypothetical protein